MPRTIVALDLDYFFAQCEQIRRPDIKDKPVVICVFSGRTQDSGAISTCNYLARSLGVRSGMPITLAKKMLKKHESAVFLPVDKEYYDSISDRIMQILRNHTMKMEQVSVDEAYLDLTDRTKGEYSRAKEIAAKIKAEILEAEYLTCSVGIGPNKLVAKMAADAAKPNGLVVVEPERVQDFLYPLTIGRLFGIGPKTERKLNSLGVNTIRDLARFDEERLAREFGKNLGPSLRRSAQGLDDDPVRERELEQLSRIITLKHDATSYDFEEEMSPLCHDIADRLTAKALQCRSVGIIAITTELHVRSHAKALDIPTNLEERIKNSVDDLFRSFFNENENLKIRRAGVKVSGLTHNSKVIDTSLTDFIGRF
jgi:DNA polymerase IV (DinB-like DNA polymerase)